uniref:DUF3715 domain-containing protein n=1 Tax=Macrostomum lignano TaxID=282301 RepID=A0A1I8H9D3_9PLAT
MNSPLMPPFKPRCSNSQFQALRHCQTPSLSLSERSSGPKDNNNIANCSNNNNIGSASPIKKKKKKVTTAAASGGLNQTADSMASGSAGRFHPNVVNERYVGTEALKQIRVPKVAHSSKEFLRSVDLNSNEYKHDINCIISRGFLNKELRSKFSPSKVFAIGNKSLGDKFATKKAEIQAAIAEENASNLAALAGSVKLDERYGFVYLAPVPDVMDRLRGIAENGIRRGNLPDSTLAIGSTGVSLGRYVDRISPKFGLPKTGWLVICRYVRGRVCYWTEGDSVVEPQPMYDCHESVRQTLTDDELINRKAASIIEAGFHSSQVFLFEYGPDLELMDHPRHVLPVAAVQFKFDGLIRDQCFKRKTQPTLDRKQPKQQQQETQAQQVQQQMQQDQKDEAETLEHAPKPEQKQQENAKCSAASAEAVSSSAESSTESSPIRSRSQRRPRPVCPDRQDWVKKFNDGAYLVGEVLLPLLPAGPSLKLGLVSLEKTPSVLPFLQLGSLPSATPCRVVDSADLEARLANCGVSLTEEKPVCRLADSSAGYVSYLAGLFDPSNAARARTLCEMLITKDCLLLAPMTESADGAGALCYLVPSQSALSKRLQLDSATRMLGRTKNLIHVLIWLPIPRRQLLCQGSTDPGAQWAPVCRSTVRCYNLQDCFSGLADRMKQAAEAIGKQRIEAAAKAAQEQAKQLETIIAARRLTMEESLRLWDAEETAVAADVFNKFNFFLAKRRRTSQQADQPSDSSAAEASANGEASDAAPAAAPETPKAYWTLLTKPEFLSFVKNSF